MTGLLLVCALGAGVAAYVPPPASVHVISERTITTFSVPLDIRWLDDDDVIIADAMRGIVRIRAADASAPLIWLDEWPTPKAAGDHYHHLAVSDKYVLTADAPFQIRWRARYGETRLHRMVFEFTSDIDLDGDHLLILGDQRDADGKFDNGAIAWLGSLSAGPESLRPILPFRNIYAIGYCALCSLGSARFLKDGSFIVVPGEEPGIYHFTKDGKLDRVWQSSDFGLEINCELTQVEGNALGVQPLRRQQWVNRRAMVDDILDTPAGPALIVRKVSDGLTQWELLLLSGSTGTFHKLPFTSPSPWAHISVAQRGERIAFLIGDRLEDRTDGAPARLILADWNNQ